jgi:hypothetical protein
MSDSTGKSALRDAYAKLDWAASRHDEMYGIFTESARPGGGDERPYGIQFEVKERPAGLVIARFIVEEEMPGSMSMLAADVIHNTRVALDHTLARLKDHFGGDAGKGSFPVCRSEDDWQDRVVRPGRRSPLHGLEGSAAFDLIYDEQPLHRDSPGDDPLAVVNEMDNADKHRLLHPAYVIAGVERGVDLVEVLAPGRIRKRTNLWDAGQKLENGTPLASYLVRGPARSALRTRRDAPIGYGTGDRGGGRTSYAEIIGRVRRIVLVIDSERGK